MKTTIDIPENALRDAMRLSGAKTKRQAVITALTEFNRKHRMARLVRFSGACEFDSNTVIEEAEAHESRDEAR